MNTKKLNNISRSMSFYLRHKPEELKITLNKNGFTDVNILIEKLEITTEELDWIVENNSKKRFEFNNDKTLIRASQGHSNNIDVNIEDYKKVTNIDILYHGTSKDLEQKLRTEGISKMNRTHVHLSGNLETAKNVGNRKSKDVVILIINAKQMIEDNIDIFISNNGVYLTEFVEPKYIKKEKIQPLIK